MNCTLMRDALGGVTFAIDTDVNVEDVVPVAIAG
jgi:hypothetical protein